MSKATFEEIQPLMFELNILNNALFMNYIRSARLRYRDNPLESIRDMWSHCLIRPRVDQTGYQSNALPLALGFSTTTSSRIWDTAITEMDGCVLAKQGRCHPIGKFPRLPDVIIIGSVLLFLFVDNNIFQSLFISNYWIDFPPKCHKLFNGVKK